MDKRISITIIGGGIAGLTTAISLSQRGFTNINVFDDKPEIGEVGAGMWIAPNAMKVMDLLGLSDQLLAVGKKYSEVRLENKKGELLQSTDVLATKRKYGFGITGFARADLVGVLRKNIPDNIIHNNKKCIEVRSENNKSVAIFEDGTTVESDLIIGADGIHSKVREFIGGKVQYRYSGQTCWRCIVENTKMIEGKQDKVLEIWGAKRGQRIGIAELPDNRIYYYISLCTAQRQKDNPDLILQELLKLYADHPKEVINIIAQSKSDKILRNDLYDFKPIKNWIKNQVVVLGDAAHATTPNLGQGACQAIESAYTFALSLENSNNVSDALLDFQQKRIARTKFITDTSWQYGKLANMAGIIGNFVKFSLLKYYPKSLSEKQFEKVYSLPDH